jgi:hypothetical protein
MLLTGGVARRNELAHIGCDCKVPNGADRRRDREHRRGKPSRSAKSARRSTSAMPRKRTQSQGIKFCREGPKPDSCAATKTSPWPLPPAREGNIAFYPRCRREAPNPDHCNGQRWCYWQASQLHRSHTEGPSAHCATTLGGIYETSPPQILTSGHGRYRVAGSFAHCEGPSLFVAAAGRQKIRTVSVHTPFNDGMAGNVN